MLSGNVLSRSFIDGEIAKRALTRTQRVVDHAVEHFVEEAGDPRYLTAVTAGGMAYRVGRWAVLKSFGPALPSLPNLVRGFATLAGIASESAVYLESSRILKIASPSPFRHDFVSTSISFGTLRALGFLSLNQNLLVQHLFADVGMVASHQLSAQLGLTEKSEAPFAEQLLQAEAFNWQLKTGMALTAQLMPQIHSWEKGVDLSSQVLTSRQHPVLDRGLSYAASEPSSKLESPHKKNPFLLMTSRIDDEKGPVNLGYPYREVDPEIRRIKNLFERARHYREGLLNTPSEESKTKYLKEYQALAKTFPTHIREIYEEAAQWSSAFLTAVPENTNFILEGYQSVISLFQKGNFQVYQEARNLGEKFNQAQTQQERWRILKGIEILSEQFVDGRPEVYETARFIRGLFRYPSAHTQRQAFETYRSLANHFAKGNEEISFANREIRRIYDELDPKTQGYAQQTLEAVEKKLPFWEQARLFAGRLRNFSFLKQDPKI